MDLRRYTDLYPVNLLKPQTGPCKFKLGFFFNVNLKYILYSQHHIHVNFEFVYCGIIIVLLDQCSWLWWLTFTRKVTRTNILICTSICYIFIEDDLLPTKLHHHAPGKCWLPTDTCGSWFEQTQNTNLDSIYQEAWV